MKRHAFALKVEKREMSSFRSGLGKVWPELTAFLDEHRMSNFSIWNAEDLIFGYYETDDDFVFAEDGTTEMKLDVLPGLLTKNLTAKMIGDYQSDKPKLHTEKLAGGVTACMGFRKNTPNTRYIPDTVLKDDIKKHTSGQVRVIACYRKPRAESQYSEITYLAKNIEWENIVFPSGYEYLKELLPTPVES